jgi:hypothetical protein
MSAHLAEDLRIADETLKNIQPKIFYPLGIPGYDRC